MIPSQLLGNLYALISAVVWGSGDFSGGLATRKRDEFQVLASASLAGLILMALLAIARGEFNLSWSGIGWSAAAGLVGAVGIASLYKGLSLGRSASVAPTAAVVGVIVPLVFSAIAVGLPGTAQSIGFLIGLLGIALVSRTASSSGEVSWQGSGLAILAGLGFGGFFIFISKVDNGFVFAPLVVAKAVAVIIALSILLFQRTEGDLNLFKALSPRGNSIAYLAGILDAGGNVFYMLAKQYSRLDIAVVLSSMYPAVTVLLANLVLKEKVSRHQWLGVALCICAITLIASGSAQVG